MAAPTGGYNTAVGYQALVVTTTGYGNIGIGCGATPPSGYGAINNTVIIGYNAATTSSNAVVIGNVSNSSYSIYGSWANISDGRFKTNIRENVPGLDFILKLRPVTYNLQARKLEHFKGSKDSLVQAMPDAYDKAEAIVHTGFVAQEVEQAAQETGFEFSGIHKPQNEKDPYGLAYSEFTVPLVKSVQELSAKNEAQQKTIDELQKQVAALMQKMQELENKK